MMVFLQKRLGYLNLLAPFFLWLFGGCTFFGSWCGSVGTDTRIIVIVFGSVGRLGYLLGGGDRNRRVAVACRITGSFFL